MRLFLLTTLLAASLPFAVEAQQITGSPAVHETPPLTARQIVRDAMTAFATDNDLGKAREAYEKALRIQPGYLPALLGLAAMLEAEGDWVKARQVFMEVTQKAKPGALADSAKQEIAALDARIKAAATPDGRKKQDYNDLVGEARMYLALGQPQRAAESANAARKLDDARWEAYAVAGQVAHAANMKVEARRLYQAASKRATDEVVKKKLSAVAASILGKDAPCKGCDMTKAE